MPAARTPFSVIRPQALTRAAFAPFGEVISSLILAERLFSEYGEGPDQGRIILEGNAFLNAYFPRLSYIRKATIE